MYKIGSKKMEEGINSKVSIEAEFCSSPNHFQLTQDTKGDGKVKDNFTILNN